MGFIFSQDRNRATMRCSIVFVLTFPPLPALARHSSL
jgi:hypothetical protein